MSRLAALAYPDVRRYVAARFLVAVAVQMQTVAVGWQVFQITHDPFDLGLIGLSQFLPFIVLVLPAGQLSDRYDRRRIVLACYLIAALAAAALALLSATPNTSVAPIFGVMALFGIARALIMPTTQALLPNLVPAGTFGNAVALNTSLLEVATIGGPAVAGVLILLGTGWVYVICAGLCLAGALMTLGLSTGGRMRTAEPMSMASLFSGITFVRGNRAVLGSISLDLFAVLFGGAMALLPAFASDVLHVGPTGLGLLRAAPAVGAGGAGAILAIRPLRGAVGRWLFGCVALFGLSTLVFGISTSFVLSLLALVVLGGADMVSMYIRHLLVQLQAPDAIRGRVSAVNAVFIGASNELGEFESGVTAAWWGIVPAVLVGGVATLAVATGWSLCFPTLRKLDRFPGPASGPEMAEASAPAISDLAGDAEPGLGQGAAGGRRAAPE